MSRAARPCCVLQRWNIIELARGDETRSAIVEQHFQKSSAQAQLCPVEVSGKTPQLATSGCAPGFWKLTVDFTRTSSVIRETWTKWCGYTAPVFCLKGSQTIYSHLLFTSRCVWVDEQQGQSHTPRSPSCKQRYLQIMCSTEWMSG